MTMVWLLVRLLTALASCAAVLTVTMFPEGGGRSDVQTARVPGFGVAVGIGEAVGVAVGLGLGVAVGVGVFVAVGLGVRVAVGVGVGVAVAVGVEV